jgi:hypothetical protein
VVWFVEVQSQPHQWSEVADTSLCNKKELHVGSCHIHTRLTCIHDLHFVAIMCCMSMQLQSESLPFRAAEYPGFSRHNLHRAYRLSLQHMHCDIADRINNPSGMIKARQINDCAILIG